MFSYLSHPLAMIRGILKLVRKPVLLSNFLFFEPFLLFCFLLSSSRNIFSMAAVSQDPTGPDLHALEAIPSVPAPVVTPAV